MDIVVGIFIYILFHYIIIIALLLFKYIVDKSKGEEESLIHYNM